MAFLFPLILLFPIIGYSNPLPETSVISDLQIFSESDSPIPPRRDPAEDWIFYDDGRIDRVSTHTGYWSRVRFTTNELFYLGGIYFQPFNRGPNNSICIVQVWTEDGDNLDEIVYSQEIEPLPRWQAGGWIDLSIHEDDWPLFGAQETFSIVYGPAPGGAYRPGVNGAGWWNVYDGHTFRHKSYISRSDVDQPPEWLEDWDLLDGDLLVRAYGDYQLDISDLGIVSLYETHHNWLVEHDNIRQYVVEIANFGNDLNGDDYAIQFNLINPDGEIDQDFHPFIRGADIDAGDTLAIECDDLWQAGQIGTWLVKARIQCETDVDSINNEFGLKQIVFDSENDPDFWHGFFTYPDSATAIDWTEGNGWAVLYYFPDNRYDSLLIAYKLHGLRVRVKPVEADLSVPVWVGILNQNENTFREIWYDGGRTTSNEPEWVEFELPDSLSVLHPDEKLIAAYLYADGVPLMVDRTGWIAGIAENMPRTMALVSGGGDFLNLARTGDFGIEVQLEQIVVENPELELLVDPEPGGTLVLGLTDEGFYDGEIILTNNSDANIRIERIIAQRENEAGRLLVIARGDSFIIEPHSEELLLFRFIPRHDAENFYTTIAIVTNVPGMEVIQIHIQANLGVYQSNIPSGYVLSEIYPNPFNSQATFELTIPVSGTTSYTLYDISGRVVFHHALNLLPAGLHKFVIEGENLAAGIYLLNINSRNFSAIRKLAILE